MPSTPRVSERLRASTSSASSAMPRAAAVIAIDVAAHDASPARNSQPGVIAPSRPPSSADISVAIVLPSGW